MDIVVAFFVIGVFARLVKSDLRVPEALYETLAIYLLLAIGLKGGIELSKQSAVLILPQIAAVAALSFLIPLALYPGLRALRLSVADSASMAAHYGSVSVVTFAVVTTALTRAGMSYEGHAAVWVAIMETPGLVTGVVLARVMGRAQAAGTPGLAIRWGALVREVVFGKSVLLLIGGLIIGAVAGVSGTDPIKPLFVDLFKGVLAIFLLELGLVAGGRLGEVRTFGLKALGIGVIVPLLLSVPGAAVGMLLGLSTGGVVILATLAASASYIAAPTVMRMAVPQANSALTITVALGITFPFNILIGIPLYIRLAEALTVWRVAP